MVINNKKYKNSCVRCFVGIISAYFLLIGLNFNCLAGIYATKRNGSWSSRIVWINQNVAPSNINNQDSVLINNYITADSLKINNRGTLFVKDRLDADQITLNGPESLLIVAEGAVLNVKNIQGNSQNIIYQKGNTPLPVTLVSFSLKNSSKERKTNVLSWVTAQEINNNYFAVESSTDGRTFREIGRIKGTNTSATTSYSFNDQTPAARTYYRLKQVDFDGQTTYSEIIVATLNLDLAVLGNELRFGDIASGQVRIIKSSGETIISAKINQTDSYLLPATLQGIYIILFENAQGQVSTLRVLR
jgi:hypothetical protein